MAETNDKMEPPVWLRSREVVHDVLPIDPEIYGEMCQHYLTLRKEGEDRTTALAHLMASCRPTEPWP